MLKVGLYGAIAGSALILGALLGSLVNLRQKVVACFMAFGSGVLICALTFGLIEDAFRHGGVGSVMAGFICGGLVFMAGDFLIHLSGGRRHRRRPLIRPARSSNGRVMLLGAVLDGIPESAALGITLFGGGASGPLMLAAIFVSNFPESIASVAGLRREGFGRPRILALWGIVALMTVAVSVLSFRFLHDVHRALLGAIEAFAAGTILAMLAGSMMPEAYEEGGFDVTLFTILGFLVAFVLSRV